MTRTVISTAALTLSLSVPGRAGAEEPAWYASRPAMVTGEVLAGTGAGLAAMMLTSTFILAVGLDSPFRSPVSFSLLAIAPTASAATGAWAVGSLEPRFARRWTVAALGGAAGGALALGGVALFASTRAPSPGIELAYALGLLLAGTPVLAAAGSVVALELFGRQPEQGGVSALLVPIADQRGAGVAVALWW